jgi:hypothetical protein
MRTKCLTVTILLVIGTLVSCQSDGQDLGRLRYVASPDEIARFFQGKLPAGNVWARDNARYLHLMGEKPLVETAGPQAPQVYRLVVQTRPYGIPAIVRLSIASDGTGEVIGKIRSQPSIPGCFYRKRNCEGFTGGNRRVPQAIGGFGLLVDAGV